MLILAIRTDKPEAEVGLFEGNKQLAYETWQAHRQLAESLHKKIIDLLITQGKDWADVKGITVFQGPGSFTGLRIGISVANALAYSLNVPIAAADGEDWQKVAIKALQPGVFQKPVTPIYGSDAHVTVPKK